MRGRSSRRERLRELVLREWDSWARLRDLRLPADGNDGYQFFLELARQRPEVALIEWQQVHAWLIRARRTN